MREYQQKHIIKTLVYSKFTMVILFLLCIILLRSIVELNEKRLEASLKTSETTREKEDLINKRTATKEQTEFIVTPRGFEEYVRTTYPVVKKGEGVVVVYDDEKVSVSKVREDITFWERLVIIWNSFHK